MIGTPFKVLKQERSERRFVGETALGAFLSTRFHFSSGLTLGIRSGLPFTTYSFGASASNADPVEPKWRFGNISLNVGKRIAVNVECNISRFEAGEVRSAAAAND